MTIVQDSTHEERRPFIPSSSPQLPLQRRPVILESAIDEEEEGQVREEDQEDRWRIVQDDERHQFERHDWLLSLGVLGEPHPVNRAEWN